jgi:ParB family chromosome partitioning protein
MSSDKTPRRLGRGLEALLGAAAATASAEPNAPLRQIAVKEIRANPFQPRKNFRPEEIAELQASLEASGLLQPITVRAVSGRDGYELIAGERRLRAASALGWIEIAAIVKSMDDRTTLTLALVENLQRADLNPLEEAEGYQRLMQEFGVSQQEVARAVGKDRSTVANMLRLLGLPEALREMVRDGKLSFGHARALLGAGSERDMIALASNAVSNGWSVREVERLVREALPVPSGARKSSGAAAPTTTSRLSPALRDMQDRMRAYLQTDVRVELSGPESGSIAIRFYSIDDLDRVLELVIKPGQE